MGDDEIKIETVPVHVPTAEELHLLGSGFTPVRYITRKELEEQYPSPKTPVPKP